MAAVFRFFSLDVFGRFPLLGNHGPSNMQIWSQLSQLRFLADAAQSRLSEGNAGEPSVSSKYEKAETGPASILRTIVRVHGPLTTKETWDFAKEAGIPSKSHMKKMLKWLKERGQVELLCVFPPDSKTTIPSEGEFFYRIPKKAQPKQEAKEEILQLVKERRLQDSDASA